jgi:hypothetical protein
MNEVNKLAGTIQNVSLTREQARFFFELLCASSKYWTHCDRRRPLHCDQAFSVSIQYRLALEPDDPRLKAAGLVSNRKAS